MSWQLLKYKIKLNMKNVYFGYLQLSIIVVEIHTKLIIIMTLSFLISFLVTIVLELEFFYAVVWS